jgi:hypothetical protein
MSRATRAGRRLLTATAGAAAITLAGAGVASAHHCFMEDWNDAAYAHLVQGGTPWVPLTDLGEGLLTNELGVPQCAYVVDGVVAEWMAVEGLTEEPMVNVMATVGGGAAHQGKDVPPFSYLSDADFEALDALLFPAVQECLSE